MVPLSESSGSPNNAPSTIPKVRALGVLRRAIGGLSPGLRRGRTLPAWVR